MDNKEQSIERADWLPFDEKTTVKTEQPISDKQDMKSDQSPIDQQDTDNDGILDKDTSQEKTKEVKNTDYEELKQQLEKLAQKEKDSQTWGRKQRAAYVVAKKRVEELSQKIFEEAGITDEQLQELKGAFNHSFETEDLKETKVESNPYEQSMNNLTNTLQEYKKWTNDKEAELKFNAFFKHLELVTPQKLSDITEYLLTEEPKEALKYILEHGDKYYNKLYKKAMEKGDVFSYVEELTNINEKLEKKIKELTEKLEPEEDTVYSKPIKARGAGQSAPNKEKDRWGASSLL
jgi:hypothetical protein